MSAILKKFVIASVATVTMAGMVASTTTPASAREGGAIAAGVIGGLALGAIAGSAAANANGGYGYAPPAAYAAPGYGGGCYWSREPVYDEYGEVIGRRRVRVCE